MITPTSIYVRLIEGGYVASFDPKPPTLPVTTSPTMHEAIGVLFHAHAEELGYLVVGPDRPRPGAELATTALPEHCCDMREAPTGREGG